MKRRVGARTRGLLAALAPAIAATIATAPHAQATLAMRPHGHAGQPAHRVTGKHDGARAVTWQLAEAPSASVAVADPPPADGPRAIARAIGFATAGDGTRLYYEKIGSGPAIVFIHGLGGNHAVWFHQVPVFAERFTVITMSQRGFAPSTGRQDQYEAEVLAGDLLAVLDACGARTAVVVGQSMGGWTAMGLALRSPERVRALVFGDTVAGIDDPQVNAHLAKMVENARTLAATPPPLGRHPALSPQFSAGDPAQAYLYQTLSSFGAPSPSAIAQQLAAVRFENDKVSRLEVPALFVAGRDDTVFPAALIRQASTHVQGARMIEIDGAGHSPYFEKPSQWNEAVMSFLSGIEGR